MCQWYDKQVLCCCSGVVTTQSDREEFTQVWWGKTMEAFQDHQQDLVLDTDTDRKDVQLPQGIRRTWKLWFTQNDFCREIFGYVDKAWAFSFGRPTNILLYCSSPCVKTPGQSPVSERSPCWDASGSYLDWTVQMKQPWKAVALER